MNYRKLTIVTTAAAFMFNGCASQMTPSPSEDYSVKYIDTPAKQLKVNALNTIVPKRSEERIMRGIMMPYQSNGVMHDSSFTYLVIRESDWITESSTKIRAKKKVLGSINGI